MCNYSTALCAKCLCPSKGKLHKAPGWSMENRCLIVLPEDHDFIGGKINWYDTSQLDNPVWQTVEVERRAIDGSFEDQTYPETKYLTVEVHIEASCAGCEKLDTQTEKQARRTRMETNLNSRWKPGAWYEVWREGVDAQEPVNPGWTTAMQSLNILFQLTPDLKTVIDENSGDWMRLLAQKDDAVKLEIPERPAASKAEEQA